MTSIGYFFEREAISAAEIGSEAEASVFAPNTANETFDLIIPVKHVGHGSDVV